MSADKIFELLRIVEGYCSDECQKETCVRCVFRDVKRILQEEITRCKTDGMADDKGV